MVDIETIKRLGEQYDKAQQTDDTDYASNHRTLCGLVDSHGIEVTAAATGLKESSVKAYYRNKQIGTAMVSDKCLERARYVFDKLLE